MYHLIYYESWLSYPNFSRAFPFHLITLAFCQILHILHFTTFSFFKKIHFLMSFDFSGPFHFSHFFSINLNITLCFMHFYFKIKRLFNFDENNYVHHPCFSFPPIFLFYTKNKNINLIQLSYHHNILLHHLQSHIKVIHSHGAKDKVTKPPKISLSFIIHHDSYMHYSKVKKSHKKWIFAQKTKV